jgi:hypothetical protein
MRLIKAYALTAIVGTQTAQDATQIKKWVTDDRTCEERLHGHAPKRCQSALGYCCKKSLDDGVCTEQMKDALSNKQADDWLCVKPKPKRSPRQKNQIKKCLDNHNPNKMYDTQHGKLGFLAKSLSIVAGDYIDRSNFQCKTMTKIRKTYIDLLKARKNCAKKAKTANQRANEKAKKKAEKEAKKAAQDAEAARIRAKEEREEYRFDENDAAEIANANEAAQLDADLEKLNSSEEVTDEDLSELYAEQCVDNKDISEDDQEECDEINALLQMALQNAERTEDEKDRAEIIFKIARSRKGIKRWTSSYIDQGVCEKRSDQLNRRVKRITSKMMVVRKAHPTNPERIKKAKNDMKRKMQKRKSKAQKRIQRTDDKKRRLAEKAAKKAKRLARKAIREAKNALKESTKSTTESTTSTESTESTDVVENTSEE